MVDVPADTDNPKSVLGQMFDHEYLENIIQDRRIYP